jgi:hypothetical protein
MIEKLKIISTDRILSFEIHSDERSAKLAEDIQLEGKLKNPILVYPIDDKYLMLDDVSILKALVSLEVSHIPVQLAEAEMLSVHPWQRVVEKWNRGDLLEFVRKYPKQIRLDKSAKGDLTASQAEIRFQDKTVQRVTFPSRSYLIRVDMCARFFNNLLRNHKTYRAKLNYHDPDSFDGFAGASAVVFPPAFSLAELAGIAKRDICLPQGMVRIDQPNRVLGIDYALSILADNAPARDKELFLRQLLRMRMSSDRVAYYNGGIFMFNN